MKRGLCAAAMALLLAACSSSGTAPPTSSTSKNYTIPSATLLVIVGLQPKNPTTVELTSRRPIGTVTSIEPAGGHRESHAAPLPAWQCSACASQAARSPRKPQ